MKLSLKNIGKLKEAFVEVDGITVIAGENNTGKSTVGRALFSLFNGFYKIEDRVMEERLESIENVLRRLWPGQQGYIRHIPAVIAIPRMAREIAEQSKKSGGAEQTVEQTMQMLFQEDGGQKEKVLGQDMLKEAAFQIRKILDIPDHELITSVFEKNLLSEFNGQVSNIFSDGGGEIWLEIRGQKAGVLIEKQHVVDVVNPDHFSFRTESIYMDDPLVMNDMGAFFAPPGANGLEHRAQLLSKLKYRPQKENLADQIVARNKLKDIYDKISNVCDGEVRFDKISGFVYQKTDHDKALDVRNLSTGLKTFAILKTLLINGAIEYNGTIILDEPEIHLHPEWQLLLAELIVLIQREFGLHVLLNTHSPYFLRALQVYSAKYETADSCRYYLSELDGEQAVLSDVTVNIEKIYEKLSRPLQKLEDERWQDG